MTKQQQLLLLLFCLSISCVEAVNLLDEESVVKEHILHRHKRDSNSEESFEDGELKPEIRDVFGEGCQLGQVYDIRENKIISGMFLVSDASPIVDARKYQNIKVVASNSLSGKAKELDISGELAIDFALKKGATINIQGSGKFLDDDIKNEHTARVTLHYESTTHAVEMKVDDLLRFNMDNYDVMRETSNTDTNSGGDEPIATHVITKILYGANAEFVFEYEHDDDVNKRIIEAQLSLQLKNLTKAVKELSANASGRYDKRHNVNNTDIKIKFHGDVNIGSIPVTYKEAQRAFSELPNKVNMKNAVPLKIWLYPIKQLVLGSADNVFAYNVQRQYAEKLMNVIQTTKKMEARANDILKMAIEETKLATIKDWLRKFIAYVRNHRSALQIAFATLIPKIRKGKAESREIMHIVNQIERDDYPFRPLNIERWLRDRKIESGVLQAFRKSIGVPVSLNTLKAGFDRVVVTLQYHLYPRNNTYLGKMGIMENNVTGKIQVEARITPHDFGNWVTHLNPEEIYGNVLLFKYWAKNTAWNPKIEVAAHEVVLASTNKRPKIIIDIRKAGHSVIRDAENPIKYLTVGEQFTHTNWKKMNWPDGTEFTGGMVLIRSREKNGYLTKKCEGIYEVLIEDGTAMAEYNQVFRLGGIQEMCTLKWMVPEFFNSKNVKGFVNKTEYVDQPTWVLNHRNLDESEKDRSIYMMQYTAQGKRGIPGPWLKPYNLVDLTEDVKKRCVEYEVTGTKYENSCCETGDGLSCLDVINL